MHGRENLGRFGKVGSQLNSTSGSCGKSQMITLSPPVLQCGHQITGTMVEWPSLEVVYQISDETPEILICCVETPGGTVVIVEVSPVTVPVLVAVGTLIEVVLPSMLRMPELARETVYVPEVKAGPPTLMVEPPITTSLALPDATTPGATVML